MKYITKLVDKLKAYPFFFVYIFTVAFMFFIAGAGMALAANIIVNSTEDSTTAGDHKCTVREAINNANSNSDTTGGDCAAGSGADTITFNIPTTDPGFNPTTGVVTITLGATLPNVISPTRLLLMEPINT